MTTDGQSLHSKASQETFISLLQLEPQPMETETVLVDKALPRLPEEESALSAESSGKGEEILESSVVASGQVGQGSGRLPALISLLSKCQRYSTYTLAIFTSLHLTNTSIIPLVTQSVVASEKHVLLAREIYQTRLSEPLLVGLPIIAHVASGVGLRLLRRWQNLGKYGGATPGVHALQRSRHGEVRGTRAGIWPQFSYTSLSGYSLAVFLTAHVVMNRVLPLVVDGDSSNIGLGYVSHGFARHGAVASVSYTGLLFTASGHIVWGTAKWLGVASQATGLWQSGNPLSKVDKSTRRRQVRVWLGIHGTAVALAALWSAGGLVVARGGATPGWLGDIYDGLYSKVWL